MRGSEIRSDSLFSYVDLEARVPAKHPLRAIRAIIDEALSADFAAVLNHARINGLLSDEHFSVDGTLIQAWASMKSFRPKDGSGDPPGPGKNGERDFKGETRSNDTHGSTTDSDARLYRKGKGQASQRCFMGHALMENRHGLAVDGVVTRSSGAAEGAAALAMASDLPTSSKTIGGDKGHDTQDFVMELRELSITPHVAQNAYDTGKAKRRSTDIQPVIRVMSSARRSVRGSRRASAG